MTYGGKIVVGTCQSSEVRWRFRDEIPRSPLTLKNSSYLQMHHTYNHETTARKPAEDAFDAQGVNDFVVSCEGRPQGNSSAEQSKLAKYMQQVVGRTGGKRWRRSKPHRQQCHSHVENIQNTLPQTCD